MAEKALVLGPASQNSLTDEVRNVPSLPDLVGWADEDISVGNLAPCHAGL